MAAEHLWMLVAASCGQQWRKGLSGLPAAAWLLLLLLLLPLLLRHACKWLLCKPFSLACNAISLLPQVGVDPGLYSRELMRHAKAATSSCEPGAHAGGGGKEAGSNRVCKKARHPSSCEPGANAGGGQQQQALQRWRSGRACRAARIAAWSAAAAGHTFCLMAAPGCCLPRGMRRPAAACQPR